MGAQADDREYPNILTKFYHEKMKFRPRAMFDMHLRFMTRLSMNLFVIGCAISH